MTLDEAISETGITVQDTAKRLGAFGADPTPDTYLLALKRGLGLYSQVRPKRVTQTIAAGANGRIATSSIAGLSEGFLDAMAIEYPINPSGSPNWLDPGDWYLDTMHGDDAAPAIRFASVIPAEGQLVRVSHLTAHAVPATGDDSFTVPDDEMPPVIHFASAFCLGMLSNWYKQSSEVVSAGADITTFINKSGLYSQGVREQYAAGFQYLKAFALRRRANVRVVRG